MSEKRKENPMFDIRDCEDVSLEKNSTSGSKLLVAERTKRIKANENNAGLVPKSAEPSGSRAIVIEALKWIVGISSSLLVAYFVYLFGWN